MLTIKRIVALATIISLSLLTNAKDRNVSITIRGGKLGPDGILRYKKVKVESNSKRFVCECKGEGENICPIAFNTITIDTNYSNTFSKNDITAIGLIKNMILDGKEEGSIVIEDVLYSFNNGKFIKECNEFEMTLTSSPYEIIR